MTINVKNLGYREISRLAKFMEGIAECGLKDDVADAFGYNLELDEAFCSTVNGNKIFSSDYFD